MFKSLKDSIQKYSKSNNMLHSNQLEKVSNIWIEIVGNHISKNTQVKFIKNKTLFIETATPVWRNELELQKETIYQKLLTKIGQTTIKEIRFI